MQVQELMERYGLSSRQSLYARLKSLGMTLEKGDRGKNYATDEQIASLDELDEHLKKGGSLKGFFPIAETTVVPDVKPVVSDVVSDVEPGDSDVKPLDDESLETYPEVNLLEALVGAIASNIQPRSVVWFHHELEQAASNSWLLTTKEVKELIGTKPYCKKGSDTFTRGCWQFVKSGKIGAATAWRVEKI